MSTSDADAAAAAAANHHDDVDDGAGEEPSPSPNIITILLPDHRQIEVPFVSGALPVAALKGQLVHPTGVSYAAQRLILVGKGGVELDDDTKMLDAYGVRAGSVIHMLKGSAPPPPPPTSRRPSAKAGGMPKAGGSGGGGGSENDATAEAAAPGVDTDADADGGGGGGGEANVDDGQPPPYSEEDEDEDEDGETTGTDGGSSSLSMARPKEQHRLTVEQQRRQLLGVSFADIEVLKVLGSGCNGAVLDCLACKVPAALKIMCVCLCCFGECCAYAPSRECCFRIRSGFTRDVCPSPTLAASGLANVHVCSLRSVHVVSQQVRAPPAGRSLSLSLCACVAASTIDMFPPAPARAQVQLRAEHLAGRRPAHD